MVSSKEGLAIAFITAVVVYVTVKLMNDVGFMDFRVFNTLLYFELVKEFIESIRKNW